MSSNLLKAGDENREKISQNFKNAVDAALHDLDDGYCQAWYEKYIAYAKAFLDEETVFYQGEEIPTDKIIEYLESEENAAGILGGLKFREEVVRNDMKAFKRVYLSNLKMALEDRQPLVVKWSDVEGIKEMKLAQFKEFADLRPILASASDMTAEEQAYRRERFYKNMGTNGYTDKEVIDYMLHNF